MRVDLGGVSNDFSLVFNFHVDPPMFECLTHYISSLIVTSDVRVKNSRGYKMK